MKSVSSFSSIESYLKLSIFYFSFSFTESSRFVIICLPTSLANSMSIVSVIFI